MCSQSPSDSARSRSDVAARFDRVASIYDALARVYSAGQIPAAKAAQLDHVAGGDRVLYVGAGSGEDAVWAARCGVELTCLDVSAEMLRHTAAKLTAAGLAAELIEGDVLGHDRAGHYDAVAANFFLNCFTEPRMKVVLAHLAELLRPGGKLLIADVAVPQGNLWGRCAQRLHNGAAIGLFWLLGLVPLHPIYDYRQYFAELGLETRQVRPFRLFRSGPVCYETICAVRRR